MRRPGACPARETVRRAARRVMAEPVRTRWFRRSSARTGRPLPGWRSSGRELKSPQPDHDEVQVSAPRGSTWSAAGEVIVSDSGERLVAYTSAVAEPLEEIARALEQLMPGVERIRQSLAEIAAGVHEITGASGSSTPSPPRWPRSSASGGSTSCASASATPSTTRWTTSLGRPADRAPPPAAADAPRAGRRRGNGPGRWDGPPRREPEMGAATSGQRPRGRPSSDTPGKAPAGPGDRR